MKRKVVEVWNYIDKYATGTRGSNFLELECGHIKRQKGSIRVPEYCHCRDCVQQAQHQRVALENLFQACANLPLAEMNRMEQEINEASAALVGSCDRLERDNVEI